MREICIWCEGGDWKDPKDIEEAEEVDRIQGDYGTYDDCEYASWIDYECPVCGCIFRIGDKYLVFNEIIKEGDKQLKVGEEHPILYSVFKMDVEAMATKLGLTKELYDKKIWFIGHVPRHPDYATEPLYGLYVLDWYVKEHKLRDKMWD